MPLWNISDHCMSKITCLLCGSREILTRDLPQSDCSTIFPVCDPSTLYYCQSCGFLFNNRSAESGYEKYYKVFNRHTSRDPELAIFDANYYLEEIDLLKKYLSMDVINIEESKYRHLDVGPGDGMFCHFMRTNLRCESTPFDIGSPFPAEEFDIITMFHTLEHWHDPATSLSRVLSLLKPYGIALITVPDVCRYLDIYAGPYAAIDGEHLNHFSLSSLQSYLEYKGFTCIHRCYSNRLIKPDVYYPEIQLMITKNVSQEKPLKTDTLNIEYTQADLEKYLMKSRQDFNRLKQEIRLIEEKAMTIGKKLIIYGLGVTSRRIISRFPSLHIADSNPYFSGKYFSGRPILSPNDLSKASVDDYLYIVCAVNLRVIAEFLKNDLKVTSSNILTIDMSCYDDAVGPDITSSG
jgi:SAM-dependent methyltransferase